MPVSHPVRVAKAVEEFQDVNRDLAPAADSVAETRRAGLALALREFVRDGRQFGHGVAGEEMVVGHLEHLAHARQLFEQAPGPVLFQARFAGDVAHAGRIEGRVCNSGSMRSRHNGSSAGAS